MPTDGLNDLAAVRSIELIPRRAEFPQAAGRQFVGKREEYRNAIFVHSPSSLLYQVQIPAAARLHFGTSVAAKNSAVAFRVTVDDNEVFSQTVNDDDRWGDANIDLSAYAGRSIKLDFQTKSAREGAVGLWANPLLTTTAPKNRPNVLLYMIDTLRADHASLYGYARDTTPFLKRLALSGLVFDDCQVQATWTKPSVASMMTSLYSFAHGIRHDDDAIPNRSVTLAEQLRASGYVTASMVANPLVGRLSGLQRGFDYVSEWQAIAREIRKEDRATDSEALNRVASSWLEQHAAEPFFLYAHATDPHAPYQPPPAFENKFADPAETPQFDRDFEKLTKMALARGGFGINRALCVRAGIDPHRFIHRAIDRYDAKILHNDASLEQLVAKLRQLGILENTVIVVVSDHGEEFWEHQWTGHGQSVYQELAHSLFLMWNPKLIATSRRVAEPVQLIDLMPTLLDLLGIPIPEVVEGQSLLGLLRGQPFHRRGFVVTSRYAHPYSQQNESLPEDHIDSLGLLDASWKLVYRAKGREVGLRRIELYDRRQDRQDANDVASQNPRKVDGMLAEVSVWMQAQNEARSLLGTGAKTALDLQTLSRLRSLGYLGGKR
jgi:arylsulfatase A-like enzyme